MKRQEAIDYLKKKLPDYMASTLTKSKGKGLYCCPYCGSGTGNNGKYDGAFTLLPDRVSFYCHACDQRGDIFDLIGKVEYIEGFNERIARAAQLYGVEIEKGGHTMAESQKQDKSGQYTHNNIHTYTYTQADTQAENEPDYTEFILKASADIDKTTYHRGLSMETLKRFKVGYVESWKHPKAPKMVPSPRLIVPTSQYSYVARHASKTDYINWQGQVENKSKVGKIHFLNIKILQKAAKPIYITEGEINALSIIDVGGEAIAIGTANKAKKFAEYAAKHKPAQPLIIAMDNDGAGQRASRELMERLAAANITAYEYNPYGAENDANDALNKDREAFSLSVSHGEKVLEERARQEYRSKAAVNYISEFMDGVKASANTPAIPTGFDSLDNSLDGGLYEGLYLIGAESSIGKTSFALQLCDQIARQGYDVLFFSLEMSKFELMAKSISRSTYLLNMEDPDGRAAYPKTTRGITAGAKYDAYNKEEKRLIKAAIMDYSTYAGHVYIEEGVGNIGFAQIRERVEEHIRSEKTTPITIVDYLQILAPHNERATDKQNMDKAILELKRLSRDYKLPLIAISSFNRVSYGQEIGMAAFKESGSLEYSADVLFGLGLWKDPLKQYTDADEERKKIPRQIILKILKNRNGRTGDKLPFNFDPRFNVYEEAEEDFTEDSATGGGSEEEIEAAKEFLKQQKKKK